MSKQERAAAKAEKRAKKCKLPHDLTAWLLAGPRLFQLALLVSIVAGLIGFALPFSATAGDAGVLLCLVVSAVLYIFVLQRVGFSVRFEAGPRRLDLPARRATLLLCIAVMLPAGAFATAYQLRHAVTSGLQAARAERAVQLYLDLTAPDPGAAQGAAVADWGYDQNPARATDAPPPTPAEIAAARASRAQSREVRRALLTGALDRLDGRAAELRQAAQSVGGAWGYSAQSLLSRIDTDVAERRGSFQSAIAGLRTAEERDQAQAELERLRAADGEGAAAEPIALATVDDVAQPELRESCDYYDNPSMFDLCGFQRMLEVASAGRWSVALGSFRSSDLGLGVAFAGFPGMLALVALAFTSAFLLRLVRLTDAPIIYVLIGLLAIVGIVAALAATGAGAYLVTTLSTPALFVAAAAALVALVRPLRQQSFGGYLTRVFTLLTPMVVAAIVGGVVLAVTIASRSFFSIDVSALGALALGAAAFVSSVFLSAVWRFFDRAIINDNCKPRGVLRRMR